MGEIWKNGKALSTLSNVCLRVACVSAMTETMIFRFYCDYFILFFTLIFYTSYKTFSIVKIYKYFSLFSFSGLPYCNPKHRLIGVLAFCFFLENFHSGGTVEEVFENAAQLLVRFQFEVRILLRLGFFRSPTVFRLFYWFSSSPMYWPF